MLERESRSVEQFRHVWRSIFGVLDDEPVNVLHEHEGVSHSRQFGYLFGSPVRGRYNVERIEGVGFTLEWQNAASRCARRLRRLETSNFLVIGGADFGSGAFVELVQELLDEKVAHVGAQAVYFLDGVHSRSYLEERGNKNVEKR